MASCEVEEFLEACVRYRCAGRDVRVATVKVDQAIKDRKAFGCLHFILSGSWAEGMPRNVIGDEDEMIHDPDFPVVLLQPATDDTASHLPHMGYVIAEGNPRQPAYLRLSVPDITNLNILVMDAVVQNTTGSMLYLNGQTLVLNLGNDMQVQHGPAMTSIKGGTSYDFVLCLPCPSWPPCAADFLHRHRPHGRPSQTLTQRISDAGCHVVATSHPDSYERELEWRWSFSVAEKELIHCMDSNMSAAMYVLKILKKCVWSEDCSPDKPTGICSYYFKTACLWLNERNSFTTDTTSLSIARKATIWLVMCYEQQHVPHYFIPNQNLIGHLPLDMCKEIADTLKKAVERLELIVLSYCTTNSRLSVVFDGLKQQIDFPEDADLSDINIAATFLAIVREHEKSRECLATATARISPGSEMYRRKELSTPFSSFAVNIPFDMDGLLEDSQQWEISLTDVPEHLLLPVIANLDDLVEKDCVALFRSLLYRWMAGVYHGLAITFSDNTRDSQGKDDTESHIESSTQAPCGNQPNNEGEGADMRVDFSVQELVGYPHSRTPRSRLRRILTCLCPCLAIRCLADHTPSSRHDMILDRTAAGGERVNCSDGSISISSLLRRMSVQTGNQEPMNTDPRFPRSMSGTSTNPRPRGEESAATGKKGAEHPLECSDITVTAHNSSTVYLFPERHLTAPITAANDSKGDLSTERYCLAMVEEYYRRGISLVWPNGYDDEGFSGHVRLAAFYYLSEQWDKARDTLDTEVVQTRLAAITHGKAITPAASYIRVYKLPLLATLSWKHDKELYQTLLQDGKKDATIHPAVLALYLQARLALRRGDVSRAESALARMAEIRTTQDDLECEQSAGILSVLIDSELSQRL